MLLLWENLQHCRSEEKLFLWRFPLYGRPVLPEEGDKEEIGTEFKILYRYNYPWTASPGDTGAQYPKIGGIKEVNRESVILNILSTYGKYGFSRDDIEQMVKSGEAHDFSYQTIYTGLRMSLGSMTGEEEHFTVSEIAEALGESEENIIQQIENMKTEIRDAGGNVEDYVKEIEPEEVQHFLIMPGGLTS